jgi:predicted RNA-binding Zn-ribbon protein involved in translation (DUF1610 family)
MRSIYCPGCGEKMKRNCEKFKEDYRAIAGMLKRNALCDSCNKSLAENDSVIAFTMHPRGAHVVEPWETEYLK